MKITSLIRVLVVIFAALAAISILFSILVNDANVRMAQAYENREQLTKTIHDLQMWSVARTRAARAYITIGDSEYYSIFWELESERLVRRANYTLLEMDAPAHELFLLAQVEAYQGFRLGFEIEAIIAFRQRYSTPGSIDFARDRLFGAEYARWGIAYQGLLSDVLDSIFYRTQLYIDTAVMDASLYGSLSQSIIIIFAIISIVGTVFLQSQVREALARERSSNELNEAIMSSSPMVMTIWDEDINLVASSGHSARMFDLDSHEQFQTDFHKLHPEFQPGGRKSFDLIHDHITSAFAGEVVAVEWMHQNLRGESIPAEILATRFEQGGRAMVAAYITDLRSSRAAMERELEAYEMSQKFLDSSPYLVEIWNEDAVLVDCNLRAPRLFELSGKEEYIRRHHEFSPPTQPCGTPSIKKSSACVNMALKVGYANLEWVYMRADGELMPTEATLVRLRRGDKNVVVAYIHDMRPIKALMSRERETLEMTQKFLDSAPYIIVIWDDTHKISDCNLAAPRLFGMQNKEAFMDRYHELSPVFQPCGTYSIEKMRGHISHALNHGFARYEWTHRRPDTGEAIPVEVSLVHLKRGDRDIVVGYSTDLREIKGAMTRMHEANEISRLLMDALPQACYLLDTTYNPISFNQAAIELFLQEPNNPMIEVYPDTDRHFACAGHCKNCVHLHQGECIVRDYIKENFYNTFLGYTQDPKRILSMLARDCQTVLQRGTTTFAYNIQTLYGEIIPCEVTIAQVKYQESSGFACYYRDMRDEKLRMLAEEESRAKTRFLARMSHEVRTPMNAVMGITEIQLQAGGHPPHTEEAFLRIYNSSRLLLAIINDILDLSKVEAGKMEIFPAKYEIVSMIVDTIQLNMMYIGSKHIEMRIIADENLPTHLIGDELRIKQIMNNLISNAIKYTNDGEVRIKFGYEPIDDEKMMFVISVADTGQGMNQEQVDNLFTEFMRHNLENNRGIEGSGLGMVIVHSLLTLMGGSIDVRSELDEGSNFTVRIPQEIAGATKLGRETVENLRNIDNVHTHLKRINARQREPMPYGKILVVDDVESNLYVVKGFLMPYRLVVDTVDSGFAAINRINEGRVYDIIFMDHMMPGMDGIETTRLIREGGYTAPIIALTANATSGIATMFLENGFDAYISKPIDPGILDTILMRYVRDVQDPEIIQNAHMMHPHSFDAAQDRLPDKLIASFLRDAQKALDLLMPMMDKELNYADFNMFTIQTHALKSALANIGYNDLSKEAYDLEMASQKSDNDFINARTGGFIDSLRGIVNELSANHIIDAPISAADKEKIVFVIDDSNTNLTAAEAALEDFYTVVTIPSGEKAIKLLQKIRPDIILLDIEMPEMNGFELLEHLKADPDFSQIPVIFLTATMNTETEKRAYDMGIVDFIIKPFSAPILLERIEMHV